MTETTQETIKFARSWLETAEKFGAPNAPTTGMMTALARAVVELADEVKKLESINMDHLEELDHQEWLLDKANEELTALKEKYRWRRQSEEPAPMGKDVEVYSPIQERAFCYFSPRIVPSYWFWRPLNLPEVEVAE